ncbi:hypothetical protein LCGC14_1802880 [marine sediment metagenome]|uniref:Uncharacterized protein n=1 Tax=marine sediment metagenome TaxID=412755 RepID=A0A0F9HBV3_9ZZZZ
MTGWVLIWILVVRVGFEFIIIPDEQQMPSHDTCIQTKYAKEKQLSENPVEWGDFTSYSVRCEYKK